MREIITEDSERKWVLVKEWVTKAGLKARVHQCIWKMGGVLNNHYCGYVQKMDNDNRNYYDSNEIEVHGGVTFDGELLNLSGDWVGFDMAHLDDENIPQPEKYAEIECERLAEQLINNI